MRIKTGFTLFKAGLFIFSFLLLTPKISFSYAAGSDVSSLIFQGADLHHRGELDKAILKFESAVRLDSKNEYAHNQLGVLYAKKNRFDSAFREFSIVEKIDKRNTFAVLWQGIIYLRQEKVDKAFEKFNEVIKVDPDNADAYYFTGAIYNFRHNPSMAVEYLKKARDADSMEAETHFRLAKAFHNMDMTANAMLEYERALEIKPEYTQAINEKGWLCYNQGNIKSAIAYWKKVLEINNRDRDAVFNLTKVYNELAWKHLMSDRLKEAIDYWEKTVLINSGNKAARYYLNKYKKH